MGEIIRDHALLREKVEEWKKEGAVVVFANGCFDILHVGHVRYLKAAKAEGDRLVVAVNSDESVRRLKGAPRPLLPLEDRLFLLSEIRWVDAVTPFFDDDVRALLRLLKPHVHAKGTDYTPQTVPEREEVAAYGGRVAVVGDPKDHASSGLIEKIRRAYGKKDD